MSDRSIFDDILGGQPAASTSLSSQIDQFQAQNMSPTDILAMARKIPQTVGGIIPELGSVIPQLGRIPIKPLNKLNDLMAIPNIIKFGTGGEFQSSLYASDLNAHHAKFKFLFKVNFIGFGTEHFYRYVHRCDKPRVRINHQDVNYYNFRTRVQTSVTYDPLSMSFLDEIGDTVNQFFTNYMKERAGTASGNYGIHTGFGPSSSSKPYKNGYSAGKKIIIEQIFMGGTKTNRFTFINPRIESFDFDELNMEDSNGNMVNIVFSYDAFTSETVDLETSYSWGKTDLLRGGGTSGPTNGHSIDGVNGQSPSSHKGMGIGGTPSNGEYQPNILQAAMSAGQSLINNAGTSIGTLLGRPVFNQPSVVTSAATTWQRDVQSSLNSVMDGSNIKNLFS